MVCFHSSSMNDKQTVTKMPGKTILLSPIELKSTFKNPLTYTNKYLIKKQRLLQSKNKKCHFMRSTLNIINISLIDKNIQKSNCGDDGSDDFNNDDRDIGNEAEDDNDNNGDTNEDVGDDEKFGNDGGTNDSSEDNDDDDEDANDHDGDDNNDGGEC